MKIRVFLSGRNYHVAETIPQTLDLSDGATVDEALEALGRLMPEDAKLPPSCLVAVSGTHLGTVDKYRPHVFREGDELTLIAPVAGG